MKRKSVLHIILLMAVFVVLVFLVKHDVCDKPDTVDLSVKQPVYKLDAKTLIDLVKNKGKNTLVANEIVEVEGVVKKVSYLNDRITILLGTEETENTFIICDMESNQEYKVSRLKTNDSIKLKGVFKGVLEDAIFLNCIISE